MEKFSACHVVAFHAATESDGSHLSPFCPQHEPTAGVATIDAGNCRSVMRLVASAWSPMVWGADDWNILLRLLAASIVLERRMYRMNDGIATAARTPMIATTIISSIRVKPAARRRERGRRITGRIGPPRRCRV